MRPICFIVLIVSLAGCAAAPLLGLAGAAAVDGVQAGLDAVNAKLAETGGGITSLSATDWGGVGAAVLTGITGLNLWRNKTRAKALKKAT